MVCVNLFLRICIPKHLCTRMCVCARMCVCVCVCVCALFDITTLAAMFVCCSWSHSSVELVLSWCGSLTTSKLHDIVLPTRPQGKCLCQPFGKRYIHIYKMENE